MLGFPFKGEGFPFFASLIFLLCSSEGIYPKQYLFPFFDSPNFFLHSSENFLPFNFSLIFFLTSNLLDGFLSPRILSFHSSDLGFPFLTSLNFNLCLSVCLYHFVGILYSAYYFI